MAFLSLLQLRLDEAIDLLEPAVEVDGPRPALLNDLASVLLERATIERDPRPGLSALELLERAALLDPARPEILFNRAMVLGYLSLHVAADGAWADYLKVDSDSPWATEAEHRRRALPRSDAYLDWAGLDIDMNARADEAVAATDMDPQGARTFAMDFLFPKWANAVLAGARGEAEAAMGTAARIGDALASANGDRIVADAVAGFVASSSERRREDRLARAVVELAHGSEAQRLFDAETALARFSASRELLGEHPLGLYAELSIAVGEALQDRHDDAIGRLSQLERHLRDLPYPFLRARTYWIRGYSHANSGRYHEALPAHLMALGLMEATGEADNTAMLALLVSQDLEDLGEWDRAWQFRFRALNAPPSTVSLRRRRTIHWIMAQSAVEQGFPRSALLFADESLRLSERLDNPTYLAEGYWWRGAIHGELGAVEDALRDLKSARAAAFSIPGTAFRDRTLAGLDMATGEVLVDVDPARAVESLSTSIGRYAGTDFQHFNARLFYLRAQAHATLKDFAAAESDLLAAIREIETRRGDIPDLGLRVSFFDNARDVYEAMVALQLTELRDPAMAFHFVERAKARATADRIATRAGTPDVVPTLTAEELQRRLARGTVVVEYFLSKEGATVWAISPERIGFRRLDATSEELSALIDQVAPSLERRDDAFDDFARRLFSELLAPIRSDIEAATHLVLVPDGPLHMLPFAALVDPDTGRHVLRDWEISTYTSAALHRVQAGPSVGRPLDNALVVSNPRFDVARFPRLASLRGAEGARSAIASTYPRATELTGKRATRDAFLRALDNVDVVHFGGHFVMNPKSPSTSFLVLAQDEDRDDPGVLYIHELAARAVGPPLFVLAACRTAQGPLSPSEGLAGLLVHLQPSGVDTIVASLANVEDAATAELFSAFHRFYRELGDVRRALYHAQRELVDHEDLALRHPSVWAPFLVLGK